MRVAVSGSSGLVGTALTTRLTQDGHEVRRLVRHRERAPDQVFWDPRGGTIDTAGLEGLDAVVHLAGESIDQRWTAERKERIRASRVEGTRNLATALAGLDEPPGVLVSGSAVGYYGPGDELVHEDTPPGDDFLARVAAAWEEAARPAAEAGIRLVHNRTSLVLSADGGALAKMLPPFKMGLGGRIGSGEQVWSWVGLPDMVDALIHLIESDLEGPVHVAAPNPVRAKTFTDTLGRVLRRPTLLPLPAFAVKLMFGEMGKTLLLQGQRVSADRLLKSGFVFQDPDLEGALRNVLGRPAD